MLCAWLKVILILTRVCSTLHKHDIHCGTWMCLLHYGHRLAIWMTARTQLPLGTTSRLKGKGDYLLLMIWMSCCQRWITDWLLWTAGAERHYFLNKLVALNGFVNIPPNYTLKSWKVYTECRMITSVEHVLIKTVVNVECILNTYITTE